MARQYQMHHHSSLDFFSVRVQRCGSFCVVEPNYCEFRFVVFSHDFHVPGDYLAEVLSLPNLLIGFSYDFSES